MPTIKDRLSQEGLLKSVPLTAAVDALLSTMQRVSFAPTGEGEIGKVRFGVNEQAFGAFDLNLTLPLAERDYVLTFTGAPGARTGFRLGVSLQEGPQQKLFTFVETLPGRGLKAAALHTAADAEWLEPVGGDVVLTGGTPVLVCNGEAGTNATISLSSNLRPPDDVVVLSLAPPTVLIGDSGFGLNLAGGIVFDDSESHGPPAPPGALTPADAPAWRGMAIRNAKFYLPKEVPYLGGHAVDIHIEIGRVPTPGIDLKLHALVPPTADRPGIDVRIECHDPAATSLSSFLPTLVEATMTLPINGHSEAAAGQTITFMAGEPVRVRLRYARTPSLPNASGGSEASMAVESQGPAGIVSVSSETGGIGAKAVVAAGTLATALIATAAQNGGSSSTLELLLTTAVGLSSFLESGAMVLHGAEIITDGSRLVPVGGRLRLKLDYSVAATVTGIDIGVLSVQMKPNQPLRVRVREVVLTINPDAIGLNKFDLDYASSSLEVEDPGGWMVHGPGSLFDVLGTRSGRGSQWIEVDLAFKLDLGPVKVSGATIRGTLDTRGRMSGSLRGLAAGLDLAPMIDGAGAVQLHDGGFYASLAAHVQPLGGLGARASVETISSMLRLALDVDLPGPIPLASTGLGIYGIGGAFAVNGRPVPPPPGEDPFSWKPQEPGAFANDDNAFSFGLQAIVGTAPDMGFTFSCRSGLFITTPDIAVRGTVLGRLMGPRLTMSQNDPGAVGLQAKGLIVVDPGEGVTVELEGSYKIPAILEIVVPVSARFPLKSAGWYVHLGADGWTPPPGDASEGRERGPMRASVLPEILDQSADAYLMFRGNGVTRWPRGGIYNIGPGSFVALFGFGFEYRLGLKPIVWADVFAQADILLSTNPVTFIGLGKVGGSLHIGFFSVGVDASLHLHLTENNKPYIRAQVCGTIDLFFDEIHECVTITVNEPPQQEIPAPQTNPLDNPAGQALVNDRYQVIGRMAATRAEATAAEPVWPDAIPLFSFNSAPKLALASMQFPAIVSYPEGDRARPIGNDLLSYHWELTNLVLIDATDQNRDVMVAGSYSGAWLRGKFGEAGGQPQPAELALLTPYGDLWFDALADAGQSLPQDPLDSYANVCNVRRAPLPGWAVGGWAQRAGDAADLPPALISPDPLQSEFHVSATPQLHVQAPDAEQMHEVGLSRSRRHLLQPAFGLRDPRVVSFPVPAKLDGHDFEGFLDVGGVEGGATPAGQRLADPLGLRMQSYNRLVLDPTEALTAPCAWLVVDAATLESQRLPGHYKLHAGPVLYVSDDRGRYWNAGSPIKVDENRFAVRFAPDQADLAVSHIYVGFLINIRVGVAAVGGITLSATKAANARNAASAAEAASLAHSKNVGPPKPGGQDISTRCVLEPGKTYRFDIAMRWSATLHRYDDHGKKDEIAHRPASADDDTTITRSFWFCTAPLQGEEDEQESLFQKARFLLARQDVFNPLMLERHLRGYEPAQNELHRFGSDPVRVHFGVSHVAILANAYGFQLACSIRRLDRLPDVEPDRKIPFTMVWPDTTNFMIGGEIARAKAYLGSDCGLPPPGVVLQAPVNLTAQTWYEVYTLAKSLHPADVRDGRLPGVVFRTSRWANASEMLGALQFPRAGWGEATGEIEIPAGFALSPGAIEDDDAAFDAYLDALGLDGWPVADNPRTTLFWRREGTGWCCAGVLIESPEPIHRPGRFDVRRLRAQSVNAGHVTFDIVRRDRSGSRLLMLTSTPFVPGYIRRRPLVPDRLCLEAIDRFPGQPAVTVSGYVRLPTKPRFAQEVA